jgi:hypothetical protein
MRVLKYLQTQHTTQLSVIIYKIYNSGQNISEKYETSDQGKVLRTPVRHSLYTAAAAKQYNSKHNGTV